jgi:hypothetical protein
MKTDGCWNVKDSVRNNLLSTHKFRVYATMIVLS